MKLTGAIEFPKTFNDVNCVYESEIKPFNKENESTKSSKEVDHTKITFEDRHGFKPFISVGPCIFLEMYNKKLSDNLVITEKTRQRQRWTSTVGRVCYIGNACYKDERFKDWDILPKVGDWVTFKAGAVALFKYRGIDSGVVYDDSIMGIIEDPEYIERD